MRCTTSEESRDCPQVRGERRGEMKWRVKEKRKKGKEKRKERKMKNNKKKERKKTNRREKKRREEERKGMGTYIFGIYNYTVIIHSGPTD